MGIGAGASNRTTEVGNRNTEAEDAIETRNREANTGSETKIVEADPKGAGEKVGNAAAKRAIYRRAVERHEANLDRKTMRAGQDKASAKTRKGRCAEDRGKRATDPKIGAEEEAGKIAKAIKTRLNGRVTGKGKDRAEETVETGKRGAGKDTKTGKAKVEQATETLAARTGEVGELKRTDRATKTKLTAKAPEKGKARAKETIGNETNRRGEATETNAARTEEAGGTRMKAEENENREERAEPLSDRIKQRTEVGAEQKKPKV